MDLAQASEWLKYALLAAFFASVIFVIGTSVIFPWWRYRLGRSLVTMDALWTITMFPLVLEYFHIINDPGLYYIEYFAASLTLTAFAALWRLWSIFSEQREIRRSGGTYGGQ